jgi:hypothetical protein
MEHVVRIVDDTLKNVVVGVVVNYNLRDTHVSCHSCQWRVVTRLLCHSFQTHLNVTHSKLTSSVLYQFQKSFQLVLLLYSINNLFSSN